MVFDHQNYRALVRSRPVYYALRDHESLSRFKLHGPPLEVDQQLSLDHIKEFIVLIVLVPMILALNNAEPDD